MKIMSKNKKKLVVPADKGRAVDIESEQSYIRKEKEQIDEGSYKINSKSQEVIIRNLNNRMKKNRNQEIVGSEQISDSFIYTGLMQFEN